MTGSLPGRTAASPQSLLRTFLWFRRRLLINQFRIASQGDTGSQLSRLLGLLQPFFFAGLMLPGLLSTTIGGFWLGRWWGSQAQPPTRVFEVVPSLLLIAIVVGMAYSLVAVSRDAVVPARMQLLPIPRRWLHGLEFVSHVVNPVALSLASGLVSASFGLVFAGRYLLGAQAIVASGLFLWIFVGLQFAAGLGLQWLFRDRRRGQLFSLLAMALLIAAGFVPGLEDFDTGVREWLSYLDPVGLFLPSSQLTEILARGLIGDGGQVAISLVILIGEGVLLYFVTWWIYRHLQLSEEGGGTGRRTRLPVPPRPLPLLDPGVASIAQIQLRQALRSARGRLGLLLSPILIPALGWVMLANRDTRAVLDALPMHPGLWLGLGAVAFGLLVFEPIVQNQLASDGEGLARLLMFPIEPYRLAKGKMLGCSALQLLGMALGLIGTQLIRAGNSTLEWLTILILGIAAVAVITPLGLVLSITFPQKAELDSWGKNGNPHPVAGLFGILSVAFLIGLPALFLIGLSGLHNPAPWLLAALLAWAGICGITSRTLTRLAPRLLEKRRDFLYQISES